MRLIFIRHAEPDYSIDSLTEKGWREAKLLAERTKRWKVDEFYCSPLGRAKDTASSTLYFKTLLLLFFLVANFSFKLCRFTPNTSFGNIFMFFQGSFL